MHLSLLWCDFFLKLGVKLGTSWGPSRVYTIALYKSHLELSKVKAATYGRQKLSGKVGEEKKKKKKKKKKREVGVQTPFFGSLQVIEPQRALQWHAHGYQRGCLQVHNDCPIRGLIT